MELDAARMIGAGLAAIGLGGAAVGIGTVFGNYIAGSFRNPAVAPKVFGNTLLGFALVEATGLFALMISFMILFV